MILDLVLDVINPANMSTAQQKGVRVVHGIPMFYDRPQLKETKKAIRRAIEDKLPKESILRTIKKVKNKLTPVSVFKDTIPRKVGVSLAISYHFPFASYHSKKVRELGKIYMLERPDLDNLTKTVMDVMTQIGIWEDDSQVCRLQLYKYRSNTPMLRIFLSTVDEIHEMC